MERLQDDVLILVISGKVNFYSRKVFQAVIRNASATSAQHIIINMKDVTSMDSAALGFLALAHLSLVGKNIGLSLVAPPKPIKDMLEQMNFTKFIPTYETEKQVLCERAFVLGNQS
ncbi:MAG: STAS domain-containing protein [Nitrospirales bacterium]|nr:STAS domain-containing protein [Nitrospira sp.]MDR4501286.1 STAS domain-containing protein [Nitrospirales bacterium]